MLLPGNFLARVIPTSAGDHAWAGAIDAKYFMHCNFLIWCPGVCGRCNTYEIGDNGFVRFPLTDDNGHAVGGVRGTFTLRLPINCLRFALLTPDRWRRNLWRWPGSRLPRSGFDATEVGILPGRVRSSETRRRGSGRRRFENPLHPAHRPAERFPEGISCPARTTTSGWPRTGLNFAF